MSILEQAAAHKVLTAVIIAAMLLAIAVGTFSRLKRVSPVSWGWYGEVNVMDGVAMGGYDAVSYHQGPPQKGDAATSFRWRGAEWRFASAENRSKFEAAPQKYAPQFGGFCSFAVSTGFTASSSPTVYHLADGKLYLFDSDSVRDDWVAALDHGVLKETEANWAKR